MTDRCSQRMASDGINAPQPCEMCGRGPCRVERDVAAQMRLMKLAPRMLSAIRRARQKLVTYTSIYDGDKELRSLLREWDEILAAAEGRSHQGQS